MSIVTARRMIVALSAAAREALASAGRHPATDEPERLLDHYRRAAPALDDADDAVRTFADRLEEVLAAVETRPPASTLPWLVGALADASTYSPGLQVTARHEALRIADALVPALAPGEEPTAVAIARAVLRVTGLSRPELDEDLGEVYDRLETLSLGTVPEPVAEILHRQPSWGRDLVTDSLDRDVRYDMPPFGLGRDPWVKVPEWSPDHHAHASLERPQRPARPVVNVGVTPASAPAGAGTPRHLEPGEVCRLWVGIGPRDLRAAPGPAEPLTTDLPERTEELEIVVFPDRELGVPTSLGRLLVRPDGPFPVAGGHDGDDRLYWEFTAPGDPGIWRVRCLVFAQGTLVHVEQLTVVIGSSRRGIRQETAFRLVRNLSGTHAWAGREAPTLAVYMNDGADGQASHDFSFFFPGTAKPSPKQAFLDAVTVTRLLGLARTALGEVAWGHQRPFADGDAPSHRWVGGRFEAATSVADQLVILALAGGEMWQAFAEALDPDPDAMTELRKAMRPPGVVEVALRQGSHDVVPVQLMYDLPLALSLQRAQLRVCDATAAWLEDPTEGLPCVDAACPQENDDARVCAAGFWGFRHAVSLTLPRPARSGAILSTLSNRSPLRAVASVAVEDADIRRSWKDHETRLATWLDIARPLGTTRDEVLAELGSRAPTIAYFLTHVRETHNGVPYLAVGSQGGGIDASAMLNARLKLAGSRPLVILNGCASAALAPGRLLGLVDRFLAHGASSAVGTEITVFLDMATLLAEEFVGRFACGESLAEAMRASRVALLRLGNPLALAYTAYGVHDLRLETPVPLGPTGVGRQTHAVT